MKIQEKILFDLYLEGKPCSIKKLSRNLPLKPPQIYNGVYHLLRRGLIKKRRIKNEFAGYCNSPVQVLVEVVDSNSFKYWRLLKIIKRIMEER
jgi:predicted DNA-binding transcriptional regulator